MLKKYKLHFDLQTPWWHLDEATKLAKDFPDTIIILNHTGLPADRSKEGLTNWKANLESFAEQPNTAIKISGICVPGKQWTVELNKSIILDYNEGPGGTCLEIQTLHKNTSCIFRVLKGPCGHWTGDTEYITEDLFLCMQ